MKELTMAVVFDGDMHDDGRRLSLYEGDIHVTSPTPATIAYCEFTRELAQASFGELDPENAQSDLPVEQYAQILSVLKPTFIHHQRSKEFLREILVERGCDLERTYFDVPRLRTSTSGGFLITGIAYAWHPHRDTWYSAPFQQLNYWMPVFPVTSKNAMAFHPEYFASAVSNSSADYNYYEWNSKYRASAAAQIGTDARPLPAATTNLDISDPLVLVTPVGGLIEFSGQHLHSSVPNNSGVTRFSIDFRTVNIDDVLEGRGALNVDAGCSGSSIRDFMRASDFSPMPMNVVERFADGTEHRGDLIYVSNSSTSSPGME